MTVFSLVYTRGGAREIEIRRNQVESRVPHEMSNLEYNF